CNRERARTVCASRRAAPAPPRILHVVPASACGSPCRPPSVPPPKSDSFLVARFSSGSASGNRTTRNERRTTSHFLSKLDHGPAPCLPLQQLLEVLRKLFERNGVGDLV